MLNKKNLCIILARKGSKRIKNKNIINFFNKPLIHWPIEAVKKTRLFDEIIVSTDSIQIKKISKSKGVEVPFLRSKKNSNDFATTADVVMEVLNKAKNAKYKYCCIVYASTPFINKKILNKSFKIFKKKNYSSLIPVVENTTPLEKILVNKGDLIKPRNKKLFLKNSQSFKKTFIDTGQFYWIKVDDFFLQKKILMKKCGYIVISSSQACDINDKDDLEIAKLKFQKLKKSSFFK